MPFRATAASVYRVGMQPVLQSASGRVSAWRHAILAFPVYLLMAVAAPANAGSEDAAFDWTGTYAGIFAGSGRADNRIVDVEGFANWGNPGWTVDYDESEFVGGALIGRKLDIGGLPLRIEFDGTFGRLSASSNKLDPEGLDETVDSEFRWIATARGGMDHSIGPATVFAVGGLAVAPDRQTPVTDVDFGPGMPTRVDPDDLVPRQFHGGRLDGRIGDRSSADRHLDPAAGGIVSGFRGAHPLREPLGRCPLRARQASPALSLRSRE